MKHVGTSMQTFGAVFRFNRALMLTANHARTDENPPTSKLGQGRKRVNAKLTPAQVEEIWQHRGKGLPVRKIAERMGQPESRVASVIYNGNGARTLGK